jgi:hypothetical protein
LFAIVDFGVELRRSVAFSHPSTTIEIIAVNCAGANPGFHPIASGGDGAAVQFWFVGVDTTLGTVIVSHQGTDSSQM